MFLKYSRKLRCLPTRVIECFTLVFILFSFDDELTAFMIAMSDKNLFSFFCSYICTKSNILTLVEVNLSIPSLLIFL